MEVVTATDETFVLGEGPVWDERRHRLHWVDIRRGAVFTGSLDGDRIRVGGVTTLPSTTGAVALTGSDALLVALGDRLALLSEAGDVRAGESVLNGAHRRFNDGKPDPWGRFVVGTLAVSDAADSDQTLFRLDADGTQVVDDDLTLSNGVAWSVDASKLYSVDTLSRTIRIRTDGAGRDDLGTPRDFLVWEGPGYPDGLTVDDEDYLWVALWGEGAVVRVTPDGRVVERIAVPAPHVTSVTFAGPMMDVLVITTATDGLTDAQRAAFPASGRIFATRPGPRGLPAQRVSQSVLDRHLPL